MEKPDLQKLSRRERQIMDIFFRRREATAAEVRAELTDPPSDATVRKLVRILEQKGYLGHRREGREYIYRPTTSHAQASRHAVRRLVQTFFDDSPVDAMAALLHQEKDRISETDAAMLQQLIDEARKEGR